MDARRLEKTRVALRQALLERERRNRPISKAMKAQFLEFLALGLPVAMICNELGIARMTVYNHRNSDEAFAKAWHRALEVRSEPIVDRLHEIAEYGSADAMATVRAAEVLLKGTVRRFNQAPAPLSASATMTKHVDGSSSFTTRIGAPSD